MIDVLKTHWPSLLIFLALSFSAAFIGNLATFSSVNDWYTTVKKPPWNPPRWVFGPVWTILYFMIGCSGWLIWIQGAAETESRPALVLGVFFVHLILNALWSVVFFGLQQLGWAAIEISFLWLSIVLYSLLAWNHSWAASILFWPYAIWVGYAAVLNFRIWQLN